jgi:hypothetical protein
MNKILDITEKEKVVGEIYVITNIINNKKYIGQTRSHRLNHNKYRPFGFIGRFKDHVNECYSKKKNCSKYLNYALLKYDVKSFTCEKILECSLDKLDEYEIKYIKESNTKYPNGYNLTDGGKSGRYVCVDKSLVSFAERPKNTKRSEITKQRISDGVKEALKDVSKRTEMMKSTFKQHISQKFERFKDVRIDETNIEKYIYYVNNNTLNYKYIKVKINNIQTTFVGRHETIEEIKIRAIDFIKKLIKWQHDQIAGNLLRAFTTTHQAETHSGELG